jgi:glycosyltransferase involved in cell wall biosynthesis
MARYPERFLLYPAQTWPHKNHLRLLEAVATLRDRGLIVHLICTGRLTDNYEAIRRFVERSSLAGQVQFRGYVASGELERLYQSATALVFPSRFEGWGFPLVEAFASALPVASSNATVLPEVAGGAALLFDPENVGEIAGAIARIWTDAALRRSLIAKGLERAGSLSWDRAARTFRALYRSVVGRELTDEDRVLLAPPTLIA